LAMEQLENKGMISHKRQEYRANPRAHWTIEGHLQPSRAGYARTAWEVLQIQKDEALSNAFRGRDHSRRIAFEFCSDREIPFTTAPFWKEVQAGT